MGDAPRFRLRCWGARGTIPAPGPHTVRYGGNTACIEIRTAGGSRVILDAGSGIRALGAQLVAEPRTAAGPLPIHMFLTHRHLDHVMGLPYFQPFRKPDECVILRCGNATPEQFSDLAATLIGPPLYVPVPTLRAVLRVLPCLTQVPMEVDSGCRVYKFDARHNGGAGIFRVDDDAGAALAFAPDNELSYASHDPAVRQWRVALASSLRNVSVLMHDASYNDREIERYVGWGHSSAEEATRFAIECNARSLLLFHHHPDRSDDEIDALLLSCRKLAEATGSALQVSAAHEGMEFTI
ncbi:MAG: MBL fold metallo-hydrolase [Gemmatimonadota bacterium]|nr:MBL fold metallo-hydrolase [Gemmatimonadota bacterium]